MILVFSLLLVEDIWGQKEDLLLKRLTETKEKYEFNKWGPETGKVISGIAVSEKLLPQLKTLKKMWKRDNCRLITINKKEYAEIHNWWKRDEHQFEITMVTAPTSQDAQEFLVRRYAETQQMQPPTKPRGGEFRLELGNVCFVMPEKDSEGFSSIDIIWHNIVIMMHAEGKFKGELAGIARTLDALLQEKKPTKRLDLHPERPTIQSFTSEKTRIIVGRYAPLTVNVDNPQKRKLYYFWKMSGGGVDKGLTGQFVYYGGEPGKHKITVTVLNDLGLYDTRSLEIEVIPR